MLQQQSFGHENDLRKNELQKYNEAKDDPVFLGKHWTIEDSFRRAMKTDDWDDY